MKLGEQLLPTQRGLTRVKEQTMDHIRYEDIADFDEPALDCLSLEELLVELFGEED